MALHLGGIGTPRHLRAAACVRHRPAGMATTIHAWYFQDFRGRASLLRRAIG
jgi:hypothetical protein